METIIKKITHTEEDKKIYEQAGQKDAEEVTVWEDRF